MPSGMTGHHMLRLNRSTTNVLVSSMHTSVLVRWSSHSTQVKGSLLLGHKCLSKVDSLQNCNIQFNLLAANATHGKKTWPALTTYLMSHLSTMMFNLPVYKDQRSAMTSISASICGFCRQVSMYIRFLHISYVYGGVQSDNTWSGNHQLAVVCDGTRL